MKFWEPAKDYLKHKKEIDSAIKSCLRRGELVLGFGDEITKFEKTFADYIGTKHAVMCGAGTQALHLAYEALGLLGNWNYCLKRVWDNNLTIAEAQTAFRGDEVITTSHTFIATIDQIFHTGARPILVDIGSDGLIDPLEIEDAITYRTKAIVPVHLEGKVCAMDRIMDIAKKNGLKVVEDAAQAIGASHKGKKAGAWGDIGCFSLYPAKVLGTIGNAGVCTTNNDELAEKMRMLRCNYNIGRKNKDLEGAYYGHNFEPDSVLAAVLNVKMKYLDRDLKRRKEIAERYDESFKNLKLELPSKQKGRIYQDYVVRTFFPEFVVFLGKNGVATGGTNLSPNHLYKNLYLNKHLPQTENYLASQVRLPCNSNLTDKEVNYIILKVHEFFQK